MSLEANISAITNYFNNNFTSPILSVNSNGGSYQGILDLQNASKYEKSLEESNLKLISIIGIICNVFQPLIYLAPIKCFYKMMKEKETKKIPIYYFLFNIIQNLVWVIVSTKNLDVAILAANTISAAFFAVFFIGFLIISSGSKLNAIMLKVNLIIFSIIFFLFFGYNHVNYSLNATIAVIMETTCYLSILQYIKEVFEYEDPSYIDLPIVASIFVVNFWWVVYSLIQYNWILFIPNFLGFVVSAAVLYINYFFSIKKGIKETIKCL